MKESNISDFILFSAGILPVIAAIHFVFSFLVDNAMAFTASAAIIVSVTASIINEQKTEGGNDILIESADTIMFLIHALFVAITAIWFSLNLKIFG